MLIYYNKYIGILFGVLNNYWILIFDNELMSVDKVISRRFREIIVYFWDKSRVFKRDIWVSKVSFWGLYILMKLIKCNKFVRMIEVWIKLIKDVVFM